MIVLRFLGMLLDILFLPLRLLLRVRPRKTGVFVTVTVDGPVMDFVPKPRLWERPRKSATSLHALGEVVSHVIEDTRVRGLLVTIRSLQTGMGGAESLRRELLRARAAGKEVAVHLPLGGGTKEVYVATAATRVLLGPTAQLTPLGFFHASRYVRRALDKAGIRPDVFACGEFKSAGESLVRDSMSEPQRMQVGRMLDAFYDALLAAIASGRGIDRARAEALVDGGPYFGKAAVEAGLVDDVAYDDEVAARLGLSAPRGKGPGPLPLLENAGGYLAAKKRRLVRAVGKPPMMAIIPVHGAIAQSAGPFGNFATEEKVTKLVRLARMHPKVAGVLLHVDSPGGSALASDRMHREIAQLAAEKPVVCCMSNVAASGGYYVAAPAHRIVCSETTITGSIGVVFARMSADPLLTRLGITTETLQRGARAGLLGNASEPTDDERGAIQHELEATYAAFVDVVAVGRKLDPARVRELARGRVYTGEDARAVGLVDETGGFPAALDALRKLLPAAVRERAEPSFLRLPRGPLPPLVAGAEAGKAAVFGALAEVLPERERVILGLAASGERVLALCTDAP